MASESTDPQRRESHTNQAQRTGAETTEVDAILTEVWAKIARQIPMQLAFTRPEDVLEPAREIIRKCQELGMPSEAISVAAVTEILSDHGPFYRNGRSK